MTRALPTHPVKAIAVVFVCIFVLGDLRQRRPILPGILSDKAAVLAVNDIRRQLYDHMLHVPHEHFGSRGTSDVTSRLVQDAQR